MDSSSATSPPDLAGYLERLGDCVRQTLMPMASGEKLRSELQSLSSALRLTGRTLVEFPERHAEEISSGVEMLASFGVEAIPSDAEELRAAVTERARLLTQWDTDAAHELGRYVRCDVERGTSASITAPARPDDMPTVAHSAVSLVTPEGRRRLQRALRTVLGHPTLTIESVDGAASGFAAETVIVALEGGTPVPTVVVRVQWRGQPWSQIPNDVAQQGSAMRLANSLGIPVPTVLAVAPHAEDLDAPMLVTSYVPGAAPNLWTADGRDLLRRIRGQNGAGRFLDILVGLHACDGGELGTDIDRTAQSRLDERLQRLERLHRGNALRPDPLVDLAFSWLRAFVGEWGKPVFVHGDYRPGNILYTADGDVGAVIDWDLAARGDRHEDLATLVSVGFRDRDGLACGLMPPEELLAEYERRSGNRVDAAGLAYYRLLQTVQHVVALEAMARTWFDHGGSIRSARALFSLAQWRSELADRYSHAAAPG